MYANFNFAYAASSGPIVKFLCADDVLDRDYLGEVVSIFVRHPEVEVVQCQGVAMDEGGAIVGEISYAPQEEYGEGLRTGGDLLGRLFPAPSCVSPTFLAFRRSALSNPFGTPFDSRLVSADWDQFLHLLRHGTIYRLSDPLRPH